MKIAYKKLNERAVAPVYGSDGSAGGDSVLPDIGAV